MRNILRALLLALFTLPATYVSAQITLVEKNKPKAQIVLAENNEVNHDAASILAHFIEKISNANLPITDKKSVVKGAVVIGEKTTDAGKDGFLIDCKNGILHIQTGGGMGAVYGVETLLEQYLGVNYWAFETADYPQMATICLPQIHHAETPAFRFRMSQSYCDKDLQYVKWYRLNNQTEVFANNLWVHTFNRILPASVYGKAHPEYYSFLNGQRRPGDHSQWCLTNPEVFEIVCQKVDSIFKANPGKTMISISQNDGNNTYCQCEACKKVDEYEGSPSGNIIRFLNKLAERFPDKQFSTLAYLFSMHPPKHVKPLPNVNIMLCDIDCKREVPLTDNESGQDFVSALEGWGKISNNIFLWDYGINFDNMVEPFPNFHILKKNLQLFKKNHATMVFEQVNGQRGTDFAEMRAYMLEKLMWNPELDDDSLMQTFLKGYYGKAAPYLYQYQKLLQGALVSSGTPLWIYDSPVTHKNGMFNDNMMKMYMELFDKAENAVRGDSAKFARVQIARLPIQYSELEIARTRQGMNLEDMRQKLNTFKERTEKYDVIQLNERNNTAADYCKLYETRFLPHENTNKAANAKVVWNNKPAPRYQSIADKALTDGLYGGAGYVESWVGWEGQDADFILDMGSEKTFQSVSTDFLHQLGAWVLLPKSVTYYYSKDNKTYTEMGTHEFPEDRDGSVKFVPGTVDTSSPVTARYIRVVVKTIGLCPSWHYGVGYPAWFFMDEVNVQ